MIGARRGIGGPGGMNPLLILGLVLLAYGCISGGLVSPVQRAADDPVGFIAFIIAIVLGITVHEFMHAYTAHRLGDDTARLLGRLSLNPMAHLDPFGTLLLVLAGFGYGKPVPFNESRLRTAMGVTVVALAGPLANLTLAKSLSFAGYDYKFELGHGFHSNRHGRAILPDSLRWLWRDYRP
jgi:Zn-dependent protease